MRVGKTGRVVVRAIVVGLVTAGAWFAATAVANAGFDWSVTPADTPAATSSPLPTTTEPVAAE